MQSDFFHMPILIYNFVQTNVLQESSIKFTRQCLEILPIPMAAQFKVWVCGRSLTGIVGSNSAGGMDVSCECLV
jgi:hypothetical protein